MKEAPTAYSLLIMHRDVIYAVRDPYGNRPLCIGRLISASDENGKGNGLQLEFDLYNPFQNHCFYWQVFPFLHFSFKNLWLQEAYGKEEREENTLSLSLCECVQHCM